MTHNDITKLAYEKITDRYYKAKYLGLECIMDTTNGYINGTKFCSAYKDKSKKFVNYINNGRYKILATYYMSNLRNFSSELYIKVKDGVKEVRGTYLHPILFLDLAIWISPTAYTKANKIITDALISESEGEDRILRLEKTIGEILRKQSSAEQRNDALMVKIIIQNDKTHAKLDKVCKDTEESMSRVKLSLKRVETRIENLSEEGEKPKDNLHFTWSRWWPSRNMSVFFKKKRS
jgi:hypothetical protein